MEYADYVRALAPEHPDLAAEIAEFRGLGKVMEWMARREMPLGDVEIVHQDEFSLDFILPADGSGRFIAFGIT